jgi:hypothetical protein
LETGHFSSGTIYTKNWFVCTGIATDWFIAIFEWKGIQLGEGDAIVLYHGTWWDCSAFVDYCIPIMLRDLYVNFAVGLAAQSADFSHKRCLQLMCGRVISNALV